MADDFAQLILDPWLELEKERTRHLATLAIIEAVITRAQIRDGQSKVSTMICQLCQEVPMGQGLKWRACCPAHGNRTYLDSERMRLAKPYRRPKAHAPQAAATA